MSNQPFLYRAAAEIYALNKQQLHQTAVVFPNRRQAAFFKKYFIQIATPPVFLPELLTIEGLVEKLTDKPIANALVQNFELYKAYKIDIQSREGEKNIQEFEQFFPLGEMLLNDFGEIDAYLINIDEICKVLYSLEAIEKSFEKLTDEQKQFLQRFWASLKNKTKYQDIFLKLWNRLPFIYHQFHAQLAEIGSTTLGMGYRQIAQSVQLSRGQNLSDWNYIAFVGFNAFNKAEETILSEWQAQGLVGFWFDADSYYVNNPLQEAGHFIRRNLNVTGLKNNLPLLNNIGKNITQATVISVEGHVAQAKVVADWMQALPPLVKSDCAAILLADESLLLPVLQSLPDNDMQVINVTMGYPIRSSAFHSFFSLYNKLLINLKTTNYKQLHYTIIQEWICHPLCDVPDVERKKALDKIIANAEVYVPVRSLQKLSKLTGVMLLPLPNALDVFARLRQIVELLHAVAVEKEDTLLAGFCSAVWQLVQAAGQLFLKLQPVPTLDFIMQILCRQINELSVSFESEPLQGVQIMGLLESRGLDFTHVLLLGAAEGTLPKKAIRTTFIPDAVRRAFGLPVSENQEAIWAYVFYRLFHCCNNMQLVYNALISENSTGETSRFIRQLEFESNIDFTHTHLQTIVGTAQKNNISINKTSDILKVLAKYHAIENPMPISPTQLLSYLACRLQFFYKNIAAISKPKELTEEVSAADFGTIVHKSLELLFEKIINEQRHAQITKEAIQKMKTMAPEIIDIVFKSELGGLAETRHFEFTGIQQVVRNVAEQYVIAFLKIDEAYTPFNIEQMEVAMNESLDITIGEQQKTIKLLGKIDRVDEKDGIYRMVDFKTGGDKLEFASIEKLFERDGKKQNKAALQTLIYSLMFHKKYPEKYNFEPALLPIRVLSTQTTYNTRFFAKDTKTSISYSNICETVAETEMGLKHLIEEIFNPQIPFNQTENIENCKYCDYNTICGRKQKDDHR